MVYQIKRDTDKGLRLGQRKLDCEFYFTQMCINDRTCQTMNTNKINLRKLACAFHLSPIWVQSIYTTRCAAVSTLLFSPFIRRRPLIYFPAFIHSQASQNGATGLHETKTKALLEMEGGLKEALDISPLCDHCTYYKKHIYSHTHAQTHKWNSQITSSTFETNSFKALPTPHPKLPLNFSLSFRACSSKAVFRAY